MLHNNSYYYPDILCSIEELVTSIRRINPTHIYFQKVCGAKTLEVIDFCRKYGIKTIYATGDYYEHAIYKVVDWIVVGSDYMKNIIAQKYNLKNISVVEDALEYIPNTTKLFENWIPVLGWFGNYSKLEFITNFIKNLNIDLKLVTISNPPKDYKIKSDYIMGAGTDFPWNVEKLYNILMKEVDIIINPINIQNINEAYAKTSNRLIFSMVTGIPTVCTPIPSYKKIVINKINGFLCDTPNEWIDAIKFLYDIENRKSIGGHSINQIKAEFDQKTITSKLLEILVNI